MAKRVAVGAVAIPLVLLLCMAGGVYFFAFIALVSALALREFYALGESKGAKPLVVLGVLAGFAINLSFFVAVPTRPPLLVVVLLVSVIGLSLAELFHNDGSAMLNLATTVLGLLYVSLFFGTLIGVRQLFVPDVFPVLRFLPSDAAASGTRAADHVHRWGGYTVMSVFITIWICDSAGLHIGQAFGRHKLFPRVSPNKSWEGAVAGFVFAILSAVVARHFLLTFLSLANAIVIGVIIGTIGQLGDLAESLFKRDAGVKDSSTLIPGHGGAFDRFDSVLLVSPCVYLYLSRVFFG